VKLASNGIKVQLESIKALLLGGIAFETDPDRKGKTAKADDVFPLYPSREAANNAGFGRKLHMVSYFQGSVAGLDIGADVTLHGLKIGEVTDHGLVFDRTTQRIVVPVHYVIEGDRIAGIAGQGLDVAPGTMAAEMVRRGFRATLDTTSLLTGGKVVALRYVADAPAELPQAPQRIGQDHDARGDPPPRRARRGAHRCDQRDDHQPRTRDNIPERALHGPEGCPTATHDEGVPRMP